MGQNRGFYSDLGGFGSALVNSTKHLDFDRPKSQGPGNAIRAAMHRMGQDAVDHFRDVIDHEGYGHWPRLSTARNNQRGNFNYGEQTKRFGSRGRPLKGRATSGHNHMLKDTEQLYDAFDYAVHTDGALTVGVKPGIHTKSTRGGSPIEMEKLVTYHEFGTGGGGGGNSYTGMPPRPIFNNPRFPVFQQHAVDRFQSHVIANGWAINLETLYKRKAK